MLYRGAYNFLCKTSPITSKLTCRRPLRISAYLKQHEQKLIINMNEAFLRHDHESETFDISFRFVNAEFRIDRQFNFSRKVNSTVSNLLLRINTNIGKALNSKKNKRKSKHSNSQEVVPEECQSALMLHGSPIDGEVPWESLLKEDITNLVLVISGRQYIIKYNFPWIENITLAKCMLAGFPTYPVKFETLYTNRTESTFTWFKNDKSQSTAQNWQEIAQGYIYTPQIMDIGHKLKLQCLPQNNGKTGPVFEVESVSHVEAGPGHCPFETRHLFTSNKLTGECFRVTSYNILADLYTDSDYSRDVLFPYCPPYALDIDYRKYLILKELIGYNADIVCLQEVDKKVFDNDLLPTLASLDYDGVFNRKGGSVTEGLATFFNIHRFQKLDFESAILGENVDLEGFNVVWESIKNEKMKERFLCRSTALQATTLLSIDNPSEILVAGNTHLYFHPDADHIRLLQGYYALLYVHRVADAAKKKYPNHNVSIMLCGDFNSSPDSGIYQLMCEKHIPSDYKDWKSNEEEALENISLSHDLSFASACGTPQYTNFTVGFADCLDYIYYQTDRLKVEQVIPMPSDDELTQHTALPSVVFPSDHISICADLKWNNTI
ncbi:2',5'-phosphodiesterase 12 [Athalia rosae]|uniref:2',5'-phosphodiesterase 12 n=1 Tax=Athalia rosae TaxID=37344 RepID=UPI002033CC4F|nr:2',5'-phosphodiesterase 12 [Athalia rosae]